VNVGETPPNSAALLLADRRVKQGETRGGWAFHEVPDTLERSDKILTLL
jgi:hypothetical protein